MAVDLGQVLTLLVAIISSGTIIQIVNICMQRAKTRAQNDAAEIDTDVLESKFRSMLYGENDLLRKDLNEAHEKIRILQRSLLAAELTIGDMQRQHVEEMAGVNARLKLTEERLTESERVRTMLQGTV